MVRVGDQVTVKQENPLGNPRTPVYVRGKSGVVVDVHGVINNPRDHRSLYPPLYTVMFDIKEIFGTQTDDKLLTRAIESNRLPAQTPSSKRTSRT